MRMRASRKYTGIRRQVHRQLKTLWRREPGLDSVTEGEFRSIGDSFKRGDFRCVPLVGKLQNLVCGLRITIIRREKPGQIMRKTGDLDNRLKKLLDALRIPDEEQLTRVHPEEGETPFFCLLEDDNLVTGFDVTTEQLLEPVSPDGNEADVVAIITAEIWPTRITAWTERFLGGILTR